MDDFGWSWERLMSGPGRYNIYRFLRDAGRGEELPWLRAQAHQGDPALAISRAALAGTSPLCEQTLDVFVALSCDGRYRGCWQHRCR